MSEILTPDTALTRPLDAAAVEAELTALAERYRAAGGLGIQILNQIGRAHV